MIACCISTWTINFLYVTCNLYSALISTRSIFSILSGVLFPVSRIVVTLRVSLSARAQQKEVAHAHKRCDAHPVPGSDRAVTPIMPCREKALPMLTE